MELGATVPAAGAVLAVVAVVAAPAEPVRLSWQTAAKPIAGTSISRHFRLPVGGDPRPELADDPHADQGVRMCDPSRSRVPSVPVRPRPVDHAGVTVPRYETLSDGI